MDKNRHNRWLAYAEGIHKVTIGCEIDTKCLHNQYTNPRLLPKIYLVWMIYNIIGYFQIQ